MRALRTHGACTSSRGRGRHLLVAESGRPKDAIRGLIELVSTGHRRGRGHTGDAAAQAPHQRTDLFAAKAVRARLGWRLSLFIAVGGVKSSRANGPLINSLMVLWIGQPLMCCAAMGSVFLSVG